MALEKYLRNLTEETENREQNLDKKALKGLYTIMHIWEGNIPLCKLVT